MTTAEPINPASQPEGQSRPPALAIDWDLYGQYLADSGLPEADRRLLIETLWSIIVSFVDLGFGLSSLEDSCGQPALPDPKATAVLPPVLDYGEITATRSFEGAAAVAPASPSERRPNAS